MTVTLDSNFMLLGDADLRTIDFDRDVSLAELLNEISSRSADSVQILVTSGAALDEGWEIEVNGCTFFGLVDGLDTVLHDGDRVAINLSLICGG